MAVNIGPRIGIDGEKEYRKEINNLITQQKTFSAQMRELESSFDDTTSAMDKNRKKTELLKKQISNQEKEVEKLEKGLQQCADKFGDNATETLKWKQAVSNAKTELNQLKSSLGKIPKPVEQIGKSMQDVGHKITGFGEGFTKYVSAPVAALGGLSVAAFNEVDEGLDIVTVKTGATGEALEGLQTSVKNLATQIPTDFATAGEAVGEVNTRFGLTGTELETLSGKFIKFAKLNNTEVSSSVDKVQKVMAAFGMETDEADELLDALNATGQKTGVSMDTLETSMIKNSAALQNMGFDAYDAAGFLGSVETSGADTSVVLAGLSKALTNAADDGKSLPQALGEFQTIMQSTATDQEKLTAAVELFGKKAGPAIYDACKKGSLSFETLATDAEDYLGSVETTFENTIDAPDKFQISLNKLKEVGSQLGGELLEIAMPAIEKIGEAAETAGGLFDGLTDDEKEMVAYTVAAFAVGGPAIVAIGNITTAAGKVVEGFNKIPGAVETVGKVISNVCSPAGIALLALGGLTAALIYSRDQALKSNTELQTMLTDTSEATEALKTSTEDLRKVFEEAEENIDSINAKSAVADELVEELYNLESQSKKTATEQARMYTIVEELNTMYPNLSLEIDKTTGSLSKGKTEVKGYIDEAKKLALIEAYGNASKKSLEALATQSVNLKKAQQAQAEGQEYVAKAQKEYNEAVANAPTAMNKQNAMLDEASGRWVVVDANITNAANAVKIAEGNMVELNQAVTDGEAAVADAEAEYNLYKESQEELAASMTETTKAEEKGTEAADDHTKAISAETAAAEESSGAMKERAQDFISSANDIAKGVNDEVRAWDDLYRATRESIEGQLGLFEEWQQDTEVTAASILKNLESQTVGMTNYATNMEKLSAAAVQSADPNFKALVQSIADMGVDGAAYAQALVESMEGDKEQFNAILDQFGANTQAKDNLAQIETYITSGFTTRTVAALKGGILATLDTIGKSKSFQKLKTNAKEALKSVNTDTTAYVSATATASNNIRTNFALGFQSLPSTAATATATATANTQASINGMKLAPKVSKVGVPYNVLSEAKGKITNGVDDIHGKVTKVTGAAAAAKTAAAAASANLTVSATMEITNPTSAAATAAQKISAWFANNPITTFVKAIGSATKNANGGVIRHETLSWLAEGDKPEVVIPTDPAKRARGLELYEQAGEMLGVEKAVAEPTTTSIPSGVSSHPDSGTTKIDLDAMYVAVESAARRGMENANVRIFWNNREAGRIMKDMGVVFA